METKRVTIYDVARAAGVSHMTVSRVVRGIASVSPATQSKVQEAIQQLGYRPDPMLSSLAAYRKRLQPTSHGGVLAFFDCDGTEFSKRVMVGAQEEARNLGYTIERFQLDRSASAQARLSRTLFNRGVVGLLFGPASAAREFAGWRWERFVPVSLGALTHNPRMNEVAMDYFDAAYFGCELLQNKGCLRIGFAVDTSLEKRTGNRWLGGYLASLATRAATAYRFTGDVNHLDDFKAWAQRKRLDGLLTIHAPLALQLTGVECLFLNDFDALPDHLALCLAPEAIGTEGVRLVHHLLLRQETGLPAHFKRVALQGEWKLPTCRPLGH